MKLRWRSFYMCGTHYLDTRRPILLKLWSSLVNPEHVQCQFFDLQFRLQTGSGLLSKTVSSKHQAHGSESELPTSEFSIPSLRKIAYFRFEIETGNRKIDNAPFQFRTYKMNTI